MTDLDWERILFNLAVAIERMEFEGRENLLRTVQQAGQEVLDDFGVTIAFDLANPVVQDFVGNRMAIFSKINMDVQRKLKKQLQLGVEAGESIGKLSQRVRDTYKVFSGFRARMIARTETVSASNSAGLQGAHQSRVVRIKKWITARDEDVRQPPQSQWNHAAAEGEKVPLDGMFVRTGEMLQAPATGMIAGNNVQCRCAMIFSRN